MPKKLYRDKNKGVIGGVCAGLGEYFNIDPVIIRILLLLLFFTGGIGFLAYIIAWIIVPERSELELNSEEEKTDPNVSKEDLGDKKESTKLIGGIFLILLGILLLFDQEWFFAKFITNIIKIITNYFVPLLLVLIGLYFITQGKKKRSSIDNNKQTKTEE